MLIGTRKVRSAGRASGSIEITLPPELAPLEGVDCRIVLRDGARPEIVLEADLAPAVTVFTRAWACLRALFRLAGDIGDFPAGECDLALLPATRQNGRPLLVYSYAWLVSQGWSSASASPRAAGRDAAIAGVVAPLATVAGQRLGLTGPLATALGLALANLAVSSPDPLRTGPEDLEFGAVRRIWLEAHDQQAAPLDLFGAQAEAPGAQQALQRIVSRFREWQEHPDQHALHRARWSQTLPAWAGHGDRGGNGLYRTDTL
jgi:hypothetical protein